MNKVRFIGDVHGRFKGYREIIRDIPYSIQIGDMGVGFYKLIGGEIKPHTNPPFDAMSEGKHLFIRGNHDNPAVCKQHKYYIPDGTLLDEGIFCVGGATSIDKMFRTENFDWWRDEELSSEEFEPIIEAYEKLKPDIVCTHEAPQSIANQILSVFNKVKINDSSNTREALEIMLHLHQPKYWVFGHWHHSLNFKSGETIFQCLSELEYEDYEL